MSTLSRLFVVLFIAGIAVSEVFGQSHHSEVLEGNWFSTDGNNDFIVGLHKNTIAYENAIGIIAGLTEQSAGKYAIKANFSGNNREFSFAQGANGLLSFSDGKKKWVVSRKFNRTEKWKNKDRDSWPDSLIKLEKVNLSGVFIPSSGKKRPVYAKVEFDNIYLHDRDYYFARIDSNGSFRFTFPLYMPQVVELSFEEENEKWYVFTMPGNKQTIVINNEIKVDEKRPVRDSAMQAISFMGDDARFNRDYTWFRYRMLKNNTYEIPWDKTGNHRVAETKKQIKKYYFDFNTIQKQKIESFFPEKETSKKFYTYITQFNKWEIASNLMNSLNSGFGDTAMYINRGDLKQVNDSFLVNESPIAFILPGFKSTYQKINSDISYLWYNPRHYNVDYEELPRRIQSGEFNLPAKYRQPADSLYKKYHSYWFRSDREALDFFKNDTAFALEFYKVIDQLREVLTYEAEDSAQYAMAEKEIASPRGRWSVNLSNMLWHAYEKGLPLSQRRINTFLRFNPVVTGTEETVLAAQNLIYTASLLSASSTIHEEDKSKFCLISNEEQFRNYMKQFEGKVVVTTLFPHYYEKEGTETQLFRTKVLQEKYPQVVFVKAIKERNRNDRDEILRKYLATFEKNDELRNTIYISDSVSLFYQWYFGWNYMTPVNIFTKEGFVHRYTFRNNRKFFDRQDIDIPSEIDSVLQGKAIITEKLAKYFIGGHKWYLMINSGKYYSYINAGMRRDLKMDKPQLQVLEVPDSTHWKEYAVDVEKKEKKDDGSFRIFKEYEYNYGKEASGEVFDYEYSLKSNIIEVSQKGQVRKRFKIVSIGQENMILEQI